MPAPQKTQRHSATSVSWYAAPTPPSPLPPQVRGERLTCIDSADRIPDILTQIAAATAPGAAAPQAGRAGKFLLIGPPALHTNAPAAVPRQELLPLNALEVRDNIVQLWSRGGLPGSYFAADDPASRQWRDTLLAEYIDRDFRQADTRIPTAQLRRMWTMLAYDQGGFTNISRLSAGLGVTAPTVNRYIALLEEFMLLRRIQAWPDTRRKRLVRSAKHYIRDSGLAHALLGLHNSDDLFGHPVAGGSWEGFVIENILSTLPPGTPHYFYRSSGGAEIDLLLDLPGGNLWGIEIHLAGKPRATRGFSQACEDLSIKRRYIVYSGDTSQAINGGATALPLPELMSLLSLYG